MGALRTAFTCLWRTQHAARWHYYSQRRTGAGKAAREDQRALLAVHEPYVPRDLQRALLKGEAVTAAAVEAELAATNRLAACPTATGALLCYPAGVNSEALALTPVQLAGEEGEEAAPGGLGRPSLKVGWRLVGS